VTIDMGMGFLILNKYKDRSAIQIIALILNFCIAIK